VSSLLGVEDGDGDAIASGAKEFTEEELERKAASVERDEEKLETDEDEDDVVLDSEKEEEIDTGGTAERNANRSILSLALPLAARNSGLFWMSWIGPWAAFAWSTCIFSCNLLLCFAPSTSTKSVSDSEEDGPCWR
jgi:hypothetical protein